MLYPLKLQAVLKDALWGGVKLKTQFNKHSSMPRIAESWELACHRSGDCLITNGRYANLPLSEYLADVKTALGTNGRQFTDFPVLIKIIDTNGDLSVQVHPDDQYSLRHEGQYGKTEVWYIVDCEPGATILYGFSRAVSAAELRGLIAAGDILSVCNKIPVRPGDVYFIESGTLHAIGKGITLVEVQQNSDVTYRLYDYDRIDSNGNRRQLHIDKALDVVKLTPSTSATAPESMDLSGGGSLRPIAVCDYFKTFLLDVDERCELSAEAESFHSLVLFDGVLKLDYAEGSMTLAKGDSVFIPAGCGAYSLHGRGRLIFTKI